MERHTNIKCTDGEKVSEETERTKKDTVRNS